MPPKNKFTKDEVIQAALALARAGGMQAVTARALGAALGTSAKPIFGLFAGMEEVHQAILVRADELYQKRTAEVVASGKYLPYKATGRNRRFSRCFLCGIAPMRPFRMGRRTKSVRSFRSFRHRPGFPFRWHFAFIWKHGSMCTGLRRCWPALISTGMTILSANRSLIFLKG